MRTQKHAELPLAVQSEPFVTRKQILGISIALIIALGFFVATREQSSSDRGPGGWSERDLIQTPAPPERHWRFVKLFIGDGLKNTEPFQVSDQWKVVFRLTPTRRSGWASARAVQPGERFGDSVFLSSRSGESMMYKAGTFYLDITCMSCDWEIEVWELQ
jgi:hypothetical protein